MRLSRFRLAPLLAAALLLGCPAARALSVIAPTFDELVAEADVIVRGVVTDVHPVTVATPSGTAIKTVVTVQVERALKGAPGAQVTLSLLGGKVGRRSLMVAGMPKFTPGQRQILFFANNDQLICPLIGANYGRYHVRHDAASGADYVARDNGVPLQSTDQIVQSLAAGATVGSAAGAMTTEAFEARIAAAVAGANHLLQP